MHGIPDAGSTDGWPERPQPDWPEPGTPLAGEEPTIELPVVTEAMLAAAAPTSAPTLAGAALSLALTRTSRGRFSRARRFPALERRGPRPVGLAGSTDPTGPTSPAREAETTDPAQPAETTGTALPAWAVDAARPASDAGEGDATTGGGRNETDPSRTGGDTQPTNGTRPAGDAPPAISAHPASDTEPAGPGRGWMVGAGIAAAALLLTGATVVALSRDGDPGATSGWSAAAAAPHTVTAALDGRTSAGFDLIDGAERVTLRAADLGGVLYRISTPEDGALVPRTDERDGRVRLRFGGNAAAVDIVLNAAVRWDLRIAGGVQLSTIDLSAGRVGGVDLAGGASRITLTLPRPDGTLSVRMSGGVSLFDVHTAQRTPVRVRVGRGAGQVTLDGEQHAGVSAGRTFTPASWAAAVDRVDVDAAAGMASLTIAPY